MKQVGKRVDVASYVVYRDFGIRLVTYFICSTEPTHLPLFTYHVRIKSLREHFKIASDSGKIHLDAIWAKSLVSFVKMKTRRGQPSMASRLVIPV